MLIFIIGFIAIFLLLPQLGVVTVLLIGEILITITIVLLLLSSFKFLNKNNKWKRKVSNQKYTEDFEEIYKKIYISYTDELEKLRKKLIKYIIISTAVCLILSSIIIKFYYNSESIESILESILVLDLTVIGSLYLFLNSKYQKKYKEYVIYNFIKTINYGLTYKNIKNSNLANVFRYAQFKNMIYDKFESDDYITGNVNGICLEMSDAILKKKTSEDRTETIYKCIFSYSKINKKIPSEIKLIKNQKASKRENNKVELDYEYFEKYFDVFSESKILVMEILTHEIMEDLIYFYNNCEIDFEIIIKEDRIYIRYEIGDIFEGKILRKSTNKQTLWLCYNTLNFAINLSIKINKILEEKALIL